MLRSIWEVTTRGSFFFRRIWCAAMPMPTRSSDSSISSACCLVSAKVLPFSACLPDQVGTGRRRPLQLHGFGFCGSPLNRTCLRNETELGSVLEIQLQASAVLRIERKVDIVSQVGFERALRQLQVLRRFVADFAEMRESEIACSQKIRGQ